MKQGDIVIMPFPFTDLSDQKIRPAVVISNAKFNRLNNLLVAAISTKPGNLDFAISLKATDIKNDRIVEELSLPPVKIHCSILAEDAIKAAIADYQSKQVKLHESEAKWSEFLD